MKKTNKKVEQLKDYKEKFDVVWSNPKSHAIIMLSFWFIVIICLSLVVRFKNNNHIEETTIDLEKTQKPTSDLVKKQISSINSYDGVVIVNDTELHITKVLDEELITNNNEIYYFKDLLYLYSNNELVPIENETISYVIFIINNIYDLIKNEQEDYITIYKDNSYAIEYSVLYNEELININFKGINEINKISVISPNYKIEIDIENINNVDKIVLEGVV